MKKVPFLLLLPFFVLSCVPGSEDGNTKEYVIVDQNSNKVLSSYEYTEDTNTLVRTSSYNQKQQVKKGIEYEYDTQGNLVKTIETVPGSDPKTITYESEREFDAAGRLVKIIRTSSEGKVVETNFGYDETGTLRGVVEQTDKGAVLMKDY
ncbi:MAG: hypothetical protein JEZ04_14960 [Spirochaetales bacterium]|nr:hypothetical protein [Spirochaetales bacterium]